MESIAYNVLNEMPSEPTGNYSSYSSRNLAIFEPDTLYCGQASFDCYQFVIPMTDFPDIIIDGTFISPKKGHVFPVKPFQRHGLIIDKNVSCSYYAVFIGKTYLEQLSRNVTGKSDFINNNNCINTNGKLMNLICNFKEETNEKQKGYEFILENLANEISITLIRLFGCSLNKIGTSDSDEDKSNIHRVINFLNENYNSEYSTSEIAKIANLSPYHFIRVFKSETGKTPYEYLLSIKIDSARKMLEASKYSITEICFLCGFSNLSHFTTVFKKHTGMTPTQYRSSPKPDF